LAARGLMKPQAILQPLRPFNVAFTYSLQTDHRLKESLRAATILWSGL
jgi:hypothetical protein